MFIWLFPEAKVEPSEGEREWYSKPQTQQNQHGSEGDGSRRAYTPDEEIEDKTRPKDDSRIKRCSLSAQVQKKKQLWDCVDKIV